MELREQLFGAGFLLPLRGFGDHTQIVRLMRQAPCLLSLLACSKSCSVLYLRTIHSWPGKRKVHGGVRCWRLSSSTTTHLSLSVSLSLSFYVSVSALSHQVSCPSLLSARITGVSHAPGCDSSLCQLNDCEQAVSIFSASLSTKH